jgi:hypothetical protein
MARQHFVFCHMLIRYFCFLPLLGLYLQSLSQTNNLSGNWTNGLEVYSSEKTNDSLLLFTGGDLHEGGYAFAVRIGRNNILSIVAAHAVDTHYGETPSLGKAGDKVIYRVINGTSVLIIESPEGIIHDFMKAMGPDESLKQLYIQNKVNFQLSGKYIDKANNKEIIFYPNKTIAEGFTDSKKYKFEEEFDYPSEVITFGKGKTFCYKRSQIGLDIFKAKSIGDDGWINGVKLMSLQLVSSLDISGKPELKGKFTFASTQFMIKGILRYFSASDRRLIRNEIFARHGFIFKSEDLKKYFGSQDWYKPQFNDVTDQLTDLEKLNIRLINDFKDNN